MSTKTVAVDLPELSPQEFCRTGRDFVLFLLADFIAKAGCPKKAWMDVCERAFDSAKKDMKKNK